MPIIGNLASGGKKPSTPTIGTATAGNASATVAYTASTYAGKGGAVTYTATSSPGGFTGTGASPITVSGLTNGTAYTFTVTASTSYGVSSDSSAASNSVTPVVPKPTVTGGTLTSDATYYYRTFASNGTLGVSGGTLNADVFMIAGGGGSGAARFKSRTYQSLGGAGGAGGFRYWNDNYSTNQTVTIGAGGSAGINQDPPTAGGSGSNTVFGATTRSGGGGGGGSNAPFGKNGGCGGGGLYLIDYTGGGTSYYAGGSGNAGSYSPVEGYAGGTAPGPAGGAGGGIASAATGGTAGSGASYFGVTYGTGGGPYGGGTPPSAAANTGNGADLPTNTGYDGAAGGSGIVVVRYLKTAV